MKTFCRGSLPNVAATMGFEDDIQFSILVEDYSITKNLKISHPPKVTFKVILMRFLGIYIISSEKEIFLHKILKLLVYKKTVGVFAAKAYTVERKGVVTNTLA